MQYFESKWSLLEYLGKDRKDVRLVDRLIVKREVGKNERGYYVVREAWKERVEELERENEELRRWWVVVSNDEMVAKGLYEDEQRKNKELADRVMELERENRDLKNSEWGDLAQKLYEAEENVKYYKDLYEKESENNKEIIKNMYRYVTGTLHIKVKWEDFRNYAIGYEWQ